MVQASIHPHFYWSDMVVSTASVHSLLDARTDIPPRQAGLHLRLRHCEQNIRTGRASDFYCCPDYCHSGVLLQDISLCDRP